MRTRMCGLLTRFLETGVHVYPTTYVHCLPRSTAHGVIPSVPHTPPRRVIGHWLVFVRSWDFKAPGQERVSFTATLIADWRGGTK
jgi:hypothetical protein